MKTIIYNLRVDPNLPLSHSGWPTMHQREIAKNSAAKSSKYVHVVLSKAQVVTEASPDIWPFPNIITGVVDVTYFLVCCYQA